MARRKLTEDTEVQLSELGIHLAKLRAEAKVLDQQVSDTQSSALDIMVKAGLKNHDCGDGIGLSLVEPTRIVINEPQLKKALGAKLWAKVTRQVVEKKLLEACIAVGDIDANVVANCADEIPSSPYVKTTQATTAPSRVGRRTQKGGSS